VCRQLWTLSVSCRYRHSSHPWPRLLVQQAWAPSTHPHHGPHASTTATTPLMVPSHTGHSHSYTLFVFIVYYFTECRIFITTLSLGISKPQTVLDKNAKSKCILTKLRAMDSEHIFEITAKFRYKIFIIIGVISLQISTTKYLSFPMGGSGVLSAMSLPDQ